MLKTPLLALLLTALITACGQKKKPILTDSFIVRETIEPHFLINEKGDSILTGAPIPAKGISIHPDSVVKPRSRPLQSPPKVAPAHANVQAAGRPKVVQIPKELKVFTPGKDGVPLPDTVPARGRVTPALQPSSMPARAPIFKDDAITNLQYLGGDQGMKAASVTAMLEDSRGDLWFGMSDDFELGGGGISRYDGARFFHYTVEEGLIHNSIFSMLEDSLGNIWFGTGGGATRYDGDHFTHFTKKEGLSDNNIQCMLEDSRGELWFGTLNGGVNRYNGKRFIHYTKEEGLTGNRIRAMAEDSLGNIWFGTGSGLTRYDRENFTHFTTKEGLSINYVRALYTGSRGRLWIGTRGGGVNRLTLNENSALGQSGTFTQYTEKEGLSYDWISSILEDDQGNMWFGTLGGGGGVNRLVLSESPALKEKETFTYFKTSEGLNINRIPSMLKDSQGRLWFGALYPGGASRLVMSEAEGSGDAPFAHYSTKQGLSYGLVTFILKDGGGDLWIGTLGGGVNRYDGANFTQYARDQGLHDDRVVSLLEDSGGNLWFGAPADGVNKFDPVENTLTHYGIEEGLIGGSIASMLEDSQGRFWFGTQTGLSRYEPAGNGGFTNFTIKEGLSHNWIWCIREDSQGNLWFGTNGGGASRWTDQDGTFTHFTTKEGLSQNNVSYILEDSQENLWFATLGGGLNRFDGEHFTHYTTKEGLISNMILSIIEDNQNNIWLSTDKGISRLAPLSGKSAKTGDSRPIEYQCFNYDKEDGFKWSNFTIQSACLDSSNRIWWGSFGGLTMLDLNQFEAPSAVPKPRLNAIEIGETFVDYRRLSNTVYQHKLPFGKKLAGTFDSVAPFYNYPVDMTLPHHFKHLTFQFSAIEWDAPHKIKYSYRMKGLKEQWSPPTSNNEADYRNLPPGDYTFQVKAVGAAQTWSEPFEYSFRILPPWQLTWQAYLLYGLLFILILYQSYRFLLTRRLERAEVERLLELDAFKTRLYANITHEFRTPLTIILGMIRQIKDNPKKWYNEGLQMIDRNGRQLLNLIDQILDLSKLDKGKLVLKMQRNEVVSFLHYLVQSFESYAAGKHIQLHFLKQVDQLEMDFDADQLTKVVNNLLSNAVKYTPEGGQIYVIVDSLQSSVVSQKRGVKESRLLSGSTPGLRPAKEYLLLKIKDTGSGIAPEELSRIFDRFYQVDSSNTRKAAGTGLGLALTKELVQLMGGEIQVQSKVGEGTDFIICLPVSRSLPKTDAAADWTNRDLLVNDSIDVSAAAVAIEGLNSEERATTKNDLPLVLLIEDNRDVLTYLASCLESEYQLEFAMNGQEGIEQALEIVPDIIVSDVMMPEKDGYEVCDALKNDIRTSHIPIILLTAKADRDAKLEGLKAGADAYLAKPFDQEELEIRIEKLLELRKELQARYGQLKPRSEKEEKPKNKEDIFLEHLRKIIEKNLSDEGFGIAQLCREIGMSRSQLHNKLKALTGRSTSIYIRSIRLEKAKTLLRTTDWNISEVAYATGFRTSLYFTQVFSEEVGLAPSVYRMNNE